MNDIQTDARQLDTEEVGQDQIYNWITRYYLHQDQLSWSRTQTIVAVEAAVISAAFILNSRSSAVPLLVGSYFLALIWCLVLRDWKMREKDFAKVRHIHDAYGIGAPPKGIRGYWVGWILLLSLLVTNVLLAGLFIYYGSKAFLIW